MIPLTEMSRLAGRIFPCVHMKFFIPLAETKFYLLALAKHVHFSHATQLFNDFSVFLYLFARKKHCYSTIFDTFIQYQHKVK